MATHRAGKAPSTGFQFDDDVRLILGTDSDATLEFDTTNDGALLTLGTKAFILTGNPSALLQLTSTGSNPAEIRLRAGSATNKVGAIAWYDPSDSDRRFARITAERESGNSLADINFYTLLNPHAASGFQVENSLQIRGNDVLGGRGQLYVGNPAYRCFFDLNMEREQNIVSVGVVSSKSLRAHDGATTREAETRLYSNYYTAGVYGATTLTQALGSGNSDTGSVTVADATGWPAADFIVILDEGLATEEYVYVGSRTGNTLSSLFRDVKGNGVKAHLNGGTIKAVGADADALFVARHAFVTASPLVTKASFLFNGTERFAVRSTDGFILTATGVEVAAGGTLLTLKGTAADSTAGLRFTNDARSWEVQVAGSASDRFQVIDVTGGSVAPFSIQAGSDADSLRVLTGGKVRVLANLEVDAILERTANAGVTIDGLLLKDSIVGAAGASLGFFGVTPVARPTAYTQTYNTADKTLGAYASDTEGVAYTGIDNLQAGTVYAKLADLNALRVAYENLRAFVEDLAQQHNSMLDDLQALGLLQ